MTDPVARARFHDGRCAQRRSPRRTTNAQCNDGDPCTTDIRTAGDCSYTPSCAVCGNGSVEAGEDCDDGGESATCDADCSFVTCLDDWTADPATVWAVYPARRHRSAKLRAFLAFLENELTVS